MALIQAIIYMTCPNCGKDMTDWALDGRVGTQVTKQISSVFGKHDAEWWEDARSV
jgi:hypothetical protein